MSNLGPQQQNQSFFGLLQIPGGVTRELQQVQDGDGNPTGLWLSYGGTSATTSDTYVASVSGVPISNAVVRPISDGFGDYISVKDFGATGDGTTDDTTAFQNALNAAEGKSLYIPPAVSYYKITGALSVKSNCAIFGSGKAGLIRNTNSSLITDISIFVLNTAQNVTISNVAFRGMDKAISVSNGLGAGVFGLDVSNVTIVNCDFSYMTAEGINFSHNAQNIKLQGNRISNGSVNTGVNDITFSPVVGGVIDDILIDGNSCTSQNGSGIGLSFGGGASGGVTHFRIVNNYCANKPRHGIYLYGGSTSDLTPCKGIIANNSIVSVDWIGIYLNEAVTNVVVSNNNVEDTCKNVFGSLAWSAIGGAVSPGYSQKNISITGNNIRGFNGYAGIRLKKASNCVINNNTILGDGVTGVSNNAAIYVEDINNSSVSSNTISLTNVEGQGIYLASSSSTRCVNNNISNNTITGAISGSVFVRYADYTNCYANNISNSTNSAVSLYSCSYSSVCDNNITGVTNGQNIVITSIYNIGDYSDSNTISKNKFAGSNSTGRGIYLTATSTRYTTISDNDFSAMPSLAPVSKIVDSGLSTTKTGNRFGTDPLTGSFTYSAAAACTISNNSVTEAAKIFLYPTNPTASTLVGAATSPFQWTISDGVSFTVRTGNAASAVGNENFNYQIVQ